ncbi:MAG TPA: SusD/RagB family nutrient-binding outer membrane lipoprotein [Cyclobacteriaceae bacterium]|nr:SusD/RagB family nutrient-binding outer membrane lipoprotein [Cyclobacteriaceae bacterium]
MKKISIAIAAVMTLFMTSCDDYLDINQNVNKPTTVSANLVLPQALAATALVLNAYNTYGSQIGGYAANAGGYGGFNETVSYAYTPNNYANLWPVSYDNLEDYQYILSQTEGDDASIYYNAVARIMKAYNFQLLVDAYDKVPYTEALQGAELLSPAYDDAASIYASLANELDVAMAAINKGNAAAVAPTPVNDYDVVFGGDMDLWMQLANTIKLRLMVRGKGKVTFANTAFDPMGFLTEDALINPGYARDNNRQNPLWNTWGFAYTGSAGNKAWIPTTYIMTFYNGLKLDDPGRGAATYYQFPNTGTNQLGFESTGIPKSPDGSFWYPGANRVGTSAGKETGVLKGPEAGMAMFTAAESYFLQAEAAVVGIPTGGGTAKELFEEGIRASFRYIYTLPDNTVEGDPDADADDYIASNNSYLTQFDLATSNAQRIEAIITQKYIALNMVNSHEGWNEYRRTGYPKLSGLSPTGTFASSASQSSRPDRLPARILYPTSEIQYNPGNVPQGINSFNTPIFWAK